MLTVYFRGNYILAHLSYGDIPLHTAAPNNYKRLLVEVDTKLLGCPGMHCIYIVKKNSIEFYSYKKYSLKCAQ